jgi:hypothetical protein
LLQPLLDVPLLRIPNFLIEPTFLSGPLRLAICLSSPLAKTPFDVPRYALALVTAVRQAIGFGTRLHVFADADVHSAVRGAMPRDSGLHSIAIHHPLEAERFGDGDVDRSLSDAAPYLNSPWLLWMEEQLVDGVDAVHFVCPGFFRRDKGALGLARSPLHNRDSEWAHSVAAEEIATFLQRTGAWSVMFSPPQENVWSIGPRLVAGSLAWLRPGPVLLHDLMLGEIGQGELEGAYRFLFDSSYSPPPASPALMMYVHPKRVDMYEGIDRFEGPGNPGLDEELEYDIGRLIGRRESRSRFVERPPQPPWRQAAQVEMGRLMLRLKTRGLVRLDRHLRQPPRYRRRQTSLPLPLARPIRGPRDRPLLQPVPVLRPRLGRVHLERSGSSRRWARTLRSRRRPLHMD